MTEEEKKAHRKQRQHEAWERWYKGPKGEAYRLKRKQKDAGVDPAKWEVK